MEHLDILDGVVGVVEATAFEIQSLWENCHTHMDWADETASVGYLATVGQLAKMPVVIFLHVIEINSYRIVFFHATSQVVDHRLIDSWLNDNMPETAFHNGCLNRTDALNFSNIFPPVEKINPEMK